jgi:hypothetical protein
MQLVEVKEDDNFAKNRSKGEFISSVSLLDLGNDAKEVFVARFYRTEARIYCNVWLTWGKTHRQGSSFAGGVGYHKGSAAFEYALRKAGIANKEPIAGRGESAIYDFLKNEMSSFLGLEKVTVLWAHR